MKLLGVTGGIGMGKTTCAELLRTLNVPVIDTDELARELVEPGKPALKEVVATFGPEMLDSEGRLRRGELARRVFTSENDRRTLEGILHPRIREAWLRVAEDWRKEGKKLGAVIIPLLYETRAEEEFDAVLCVACSQETQSSRLAARGWTPDQIASRNAAQMPVTDKMLRSDFVIWSEGTLKVHENQLRRVLKKL